MRNVAFVAPFFLNNTLRYVRAFASLPGVRVGVISQDSASKLPPDLREQVYHYQVGNCLDGAELTRGAKGLAAAMGPLERLNGALEQLQLPLAEARQACGIEGMWVDAAIRFRDKDKMKAALRQSNVPVARSLLITSPADLWAFVGEVGFPVVIKPPAGLGARSTFRLGSEADVHELLSTLTPSQSQPAQAEEFITGREFTCETVTIHGKPVWRSGTRYFPGPLEVLENPWIQYCVLLPREADDPVFTSFHPTNSAALEALGIGTALSHMEWFLRGDGSAVVSEVGARPPGVHIMPMMSLTHGIDMIEAWAELMTFDRFTPAERTCAAGAAFFRGQGQGDRVVAVRGLDQAHEEVGQWVVERSLPRVGQPRAESYEGEGWAIVCHPTTEGVMHALRRLVTLVQVELG